MSMQPGTIAVKDKFFVITCAPHVAIKLRRVFNGAHREYVGQFRLTATTANAHELAWFMQRYPFKFEGDAERTFRRLVAAEKRRLKGIAEIESPDYVPMDFELALPPRDYQRVPADLALRTRGLLIADHAGLGKTIEGICVLAAKGSLPAVVVTMTHLQRQWERELARFAPNLSVHRITKGTPYKLPSKPDVLVITYSKLDGWAETIAARYTTVIFDEIQELRHDGTLKYDAAVAIAREMSLRVGLSATPIYNYGAEMYNVCNVLAPDILGTRDEFYSEWCQGARPDARDARKVCVADPVALGTYLRAMGMMIRRTRKEVGRELPALTIVRHVVEVDTARIHEATADVAELAQRVLSRAGTTLELMQWSGEIDWRMRQVTGIAKAAGVVDLVRLLVDAGERVVLFAWHHEVYSQYRSILEKHGVSFVMYTGQESEQAKDANAQRFIRGEADVIIISLRAGAGLDGLQNVSRTVVIGELDWSPKVMEQDIWRVHRDGQTEPVVAYYAVAEEGSDPVIADVLGLKEAQSTGIVDPGQADEAHLTGAAPDHIRRLAVDVLMRRGIAIPVPVLKPPKDKPAREVELVLRGQVPA